MRCQRERTADFRSVIFGDMCVKNDTSCLHLVDSLKAPFGVFFLRPLAQIGLLFALPARFYRKVMISAIKCRIIDVY